MAGWCGAKNVLSKIMHSFFALALVSVIVVVVGFSLAFASSVNGAGLIGGLEFVGFANVGMAPNPDYAEGVPFGLVAVVAAAAFASAATVVIVKVVELVLGLRVEPQAEEMGLNLSLHGEAAYQS